MMRAQPIAKSQSFARKSATIHVRVEKMRKAGIIVGTELKVNAKQLGYDVCCFIKYAAACR